ncbi:MAG: D-sedoheptulose 7-phosphate isomerase [Treponema sp.]
MKDWVEKIFQEKSELLNQIKLSDYLEKVELAGKELVSCLQSNGKILLAGNGGSAADAQHFAGEIVGRFTMERKSLPAISLCVDPSVMTCIGNDYGYEQVFARQIEGLGNPNDIFIGISTSGNSKNIIKAIETAAKKNIKTICLLGKDGGQIKTMCDYALVVPSDCTPRIQEVHTFTVHILCQLIEKEIFGK